MTQKQFGHSLFRWSLFLGFLTALFWLFWAQFGPLPPYRAPDMTSVLGERIWWLDVLIVVLLTNATGWVIRVNSDDADEHPSLIIIVLVGLGIGMAVGDMFLPNLGWLLFSFPSAILAVQVYYFLFHIVAASCFAARGALRILGGLLIGGAPLAWRRFREFLSAAEFKTEAP